MSNREAVLSKVRASLGVRASDDARREGVEKRLKERPRHLTPERVKDKPTDELVRLFRSFLEGQSASVLEVADAAAVPTAIAGYLRKNNLPARLRIGGDILLTQLPWSSEGQLEVMLGRAQSGDEVGLTHALAGVAETGTLILSSGADNPVTLNFMPDTSVVVIRQQDIVAAYEDGWTRVRDRYGDRLMPRTVNFISGPSRTGDIGGRIVMGAHGPRAMCVIIVKG